MTATSSTPLGLFSADSHVVESSDCYVDHIEAKYRDRAPKFVRGEKGGEYVWLDGYRNPMPVAQMASGGLDLAKADFEKMTLPEANVGAFDPKQRIRDQDRDGVAGEVLYPTIGMFVCSTEDSDYKQACMWAYNRWLHEFVSYAPERLIGMGQTAVRSVSESIDDLKKFKEMGFKGVMLPAEPSMDEDYHDRIFDPLWHAAVELEMPISFHTLTTRATRNMAASLGTGGASKKTIKTAVAGIRGPKENSIQDIVRANQDLIGVFIWGGVFERHPKLKLVCVEADAGWAPHLIAKMDHYYLNRPDVKLNGGLKERPSHYFKRNVHLTIQDDWVSLDLLHHFNPDQLLWANDFPHPDGCWPNSQNLVNEHTAKLSPSQRDALCFGNVRALYGLN